MDAAQAFYVIYYLTTSKNGISSTELSKKLALRQKTCWLFKQSDEGNGRTRSQSSQNFPMKGKVDVDEAYVGGQDDQAIGRNEGKIGSPKRKDSGCSDRKKRKLDSRSRAFPACMAVLLKQQVIGRSVKT